MSRPRVPVLLAALLVASTVLASEEAHQHHDNGIPVATLLFSTINLIIFIAILARYVFPAVRDWVRDRRTRVVSALHDAAKAKAEAERLRAEWEARIAGIEQTIAELHAQARLDAQRERDRILAAALQAAEGIRKDAERAAAYEARRAQEQLRAELVRAARRLAEAATRAQWSATDQQRSVAEFLEQVSR